MRIAAIVWLIGLGAAGLLAGAGPATRPSETERLRAAELARHGADHLDHADYQLARRELREALSIVPDNINWLYNLALTDAASGQEDAALDDLQRCADCGFTGFTRLENEPVFGALLRDSPRFRRLLADKTQIIHRAGQRILEELRSQFGEHYLYEADEPHKLVFACDVDRRKLDALEHAIQVESASQREQLFDHGPDEFVRIVVARPADFAKLERRRYVAGRYDDSTRTLLVKNLGPELRHEFTHAMHAADQHALGQEHPVWLSEGLATMYEQPRFEMTKNGVERMTPGDNWRLGRVKAEARRGALIPLDRLVKLDRAAFTNKADLAYGESASLLLYLFEHDLLKKFYDTCTANYRRDRTGADALAKTTARTLAQLQDDWVNWLLTRPIPPRLAP